MINNRYLWKIILLFILLPGYSYAQIIDSFTPDSILFINEVKDYFDQTSNNKKQETKKFLVKFEFEWNFGGFSEEDRQNIYSTSNLFLKERLNPYPYYYNYLKAALNFVIHDLPHSSYDSLHSSVNNLIGTIGRNSLLDYLESINNLLEEQFLYKTYGNSWKFRNGSFDFEYDSIPMFYFKETDLICYAQRDSIHIFRTNGIFYPMTNEWKGIEGTVTWERAGFNSDEVYAELSNYRIELGYSHYQADSVSFTNKNQFSRPLLGQLGDKVLANTTIENATYPRFISYNTKIQIPSVFENISYDGGYSLEGNQVIGSGTPFKDASLYFYKDDEEFIKLSSQRFSIQRDRIFSKNASVSIYHEEDSIFHPRLQMKYIDSEKELTLIRGDEGLSLSPYFDSYHELEMYFEALNWKLNEPVIYFERIKGVQAEGKALFESDNFFTEYRYDRIMGIDPSHPLIVIRNFVKNNPTRTFYLENLADYMRKPEAQVRALVINLASKGFLVYDISEDRATVKDKLYKYIDAKNKNVDYDVIRFNSDVERDHNAVLNTETFDLRIKGIPNVFLSDSQKVVLYPWNHEILVRQNRDFVFTGRVHAGLLDFYAKECYFEYDSFRLKMPVIDSLSFHVTSHVPDEEGNYSLVRVNSVIRDLNGTLYIDEPNNKSSLKKFPKYPYFVSKDESFVYYNDTSIENGVYNKESFYYKVEPFVFDSLNTFTTTGLEFDGELTSGGILPTVKQPIKVQEDYSLGFDKVTPEDGYPIYGGIANYYSNIELSNKGLKGDGSLNYLSSNSTSDEFSFYPDSVTSRLKHFNINEQISGTQYPSVTVDSAMLNWLPYGDSMLVTNEIDKRFNMYRDSAQMNGTMLLSPDGLVGDGVVYVQDAEIESNKLVFNHHIFEADTSNFRLTTLDKSEVAFSTNVYKSLVDFNERRGEFRSTGVGSTVEFPVHQYMCFMDAFDWYMDDNRIALSNNLPMDIGDLDTLNYKELMDVDLSGSEFISTHPEQDSLKFFSLNAIYDIEESVIYAQDVKILKIADAAIFPGEGNITIREDAKMDPLMNSVIIADTINRRHTIYNADVNVLSSNKYIASGNYDYIDEVGQIQQVFFEKVSVDSAYHTYGLTNITDTISFALSPYFDFRGNIKFYADRDFLTFDGGYRVNEDCDPMPGSWVKFSSEINPENIYLPVQDTLVDIRNKKIADAIVLSLGQDIYPAFLMKKDRYSDHEIVTAKGWINYNKESEEFRIGSLNRINQQNNEGNYLVLNNKFCTLYGEGIIDLGMDYEAVELKSFGSAIQYIIPDSTNFNLVLGLNFFFSDDLLEMITDQFTLANLDGVSITETKYMTALTGLLGKEEADRIISELSLYGTLRRIPPELENTFFLSDIQLTWNQRSRSYVSKGPIGIGSLKDQQINKYVNGYIELGKRRGGDVLHIYIELNERLWYYFNYSNLIFQSISSDDNYNTTLRDLDEKKRTLKLEDTKQTYQYIISTTRKKIDFVRRMEEL